MLGHVGTWQLKLLLTYISFYSQFLASPIASLFFPSPRSKPQSALFHTYDIEMLTRFCKSCLCYLSKSIQSPSFSTTSAITYELMDYFNMDNCVSNDGPIPNFLFLSPLSTATRIFILKLGFDCATLLLKNLPWLSSSVTLTWACNITMAFSYEMRMRYYYLPHKSVMWIKKDNTCP